MQTSIVAPEVSVGGPAFTKPLARTLDPIPKLRMMFMPLVTIGTHKGKRYDPSDPGKQLWGAKTDAQNFASAKNAMDTFKAQFHLSAHDIPADVDRPGSSHSFCGDGHVGGRLNVESGELITELG